MYLHTHGDLKRIASCRVKPFELVERTDEFALASKEVILEDGLEDVKNLLTNLKNDEVGANYLLFRDVYIYCRTSNFRTLEARSEGS